jgi:hypothetical protein
METLSSSESLSVDWTRREGSMSARDVPSLSETGYRDVSALVCSSG